MDPANDSCSLFNTHPIAGRSYSCLDKAVIVLETHQFVVSSRGCCFNPLTKCLLLCDLVKCCVHGFYIDFAPDHKRINNIKPANLRFGEKGTGNGKFQEPVAIDVNSRGEVAVADRKLCRVQIFNGSGQLAGHFGKLGFHRGEFRDIQDLKFTQQALLAIVDSGNHRIQIVTQTGNVIQVFGEPGAKPGQFQSPLAIEETRNGDLYVCDAGNRRVQRFNAKGKLLCAWGGDTSSTSKDSIFECPNDISVGFHGEIFVCDSTRAKVFVFSNVGICLHVMALCMPNTSHKKYCATSSRVTPIAICASQRHLMLITSKPSQPREHQLLLFAPVPKVPVGRFEEWSLRCVFRMLSFMTYEDAKIIRQVNRFFHSCCFKLRNQWRLFPLIPGVASQFRNHQIITMATGLQQVYEQFRKWGARHRKSPVSLSRGVMDFENGFCAAIGERYGAVFHTQFAQPLRLLFEYHASQDGGITLEGYVEIITVIEEVRHGFMKWEQAKQIRQIQQAIPHPPSIASSQSSLHQVAESPVTIHSSLTLPMVNQAHEQTFRKLLNRLQHL